MYYMSMKFDAATRHFIEIDALDKAAAELEFRRKEFTDYPVGLILLIAQVGSVPKSV